MDDRVGRLESVVQELAARVATLERRLDTGQERGPTGRDALADDLRVPAFDAVPVQHWLGLVGRTLVVLGGAYLLRALTESRVLSAQLGVGLGLVYGAPWLWLGSRAGARGAQLDAVCHALATALIGYPLVWEATTRFHTLTTIQSAALLGLLTGAALVIAAVRNLHSLAWVVTLGAGGSACGLALVSGEWVPYTVLAIGVGVGTLWLGYLKEWVELRWPAAAIANFMVLVATGRAVSAGTPQPMLVVHLLMLTAYLGSFALRTLVIGRQVIPFEAAQSAGVLAVAYGGALVLIRSTGSNALAVGIASLALAAAGYLVAFGFVERHRHVRNFFFYSLLALVFAVAGTMVCFGPAIGSLVFAAASCSATWLARRNRRLTLALHAAVYALAAAVASGLLTLVSNGLLAPRLTAPTAGALPMVALAALGAGLVFPVTRPVESWGAFARLLRLAVVLVFAWAAMGTLAIAGAAGLGAARGADGAVLAAVRTAVMVLATLAAARAARHPSGTEAGWLMYPLLVLTGLKLLFVDFPAGRPGTLFASLALYGCALIAAPHLVRRADAAAAPPGGPTATSG
jgi:hypothetical protein